MSVAVRSFAKINIGLRIGASRPDGFHELRTVYQTIDLADIVRVDVGRAPALRSTAKTRAYRQMRPIRAGAWPIKYSDH